MQKIKDILYDTNDLLVAFVIIALAAVLIWDRIGVILDYPSASAGDAVYQEDGGVLTGEDGTDADSADATTESPEDTADATGAADGEADGDSGAPADDATADGGTQTETPAGTDPAEPTQYSLYIAYGETAKQIAEKLLESGLIKNVNEFYDALIAADAATRLQAGTFIITEGVTPAEIVDILTGR
jgi:hypothetical protein